MFWRRNKAPAKTPAMVSGTFEAAKEATRRAAFLNVAQGMTTDEAYKQGLADLFQTCRSEALAAGASEGHTEAEVDAAIADLCDADVARMQHASDDEFRDFAQASGRIVNEFLARE